MKLYKFVEDEVINGERLQHVHLLGDQPLYGTTTVINEVYPPPLAWYGSAKALELLGYLPERKALERFESEPDKARRKELAENERRSLAEKALENLDEMLSSDLRLDEYIDLLDRCYKNHDSYKKEKGKQGKDAHAKIEEYIKKCINTNEGRPLRVSDSEGIASFEGWALREVDKFLWSEAHCYSERLGAGGITDFGFIHKSGKIIVGDAKPAVYPKNFIQTAAYGIYMREHGLFTADGVRSHEPIKINGYCIFDYNKGEIRYLGAEWVERLEANFEHTLKMYQMRYLIGTQTL